MTIRTLHADNEPTLGSLLLGSVDPARLKAWYQRAFAVEPDELGWLALGQVGVLADGRDDVAATSAEPGRIVLNLHVTDADAAVAAVERAATTWIAPLATRDNGRFATCTDPDGNVVQLIELDAPYLAKQRAARRARVPNSAPYSGFSVDDTDAATRFYRDTLGLEVDEANGLLLIWTGDDRFVLCYPKDDHQPATFTVLNFPVADIEAAVDGLVEQGVTFERYFDGQDERGINRAGGPLIAWFRDPAGNLLSVLQDS